ncbi:hypothetical protein J4440_05115 [Candidatus Woesearchaeota archaeon]|nr:hypothetical protein [Candidatus Woesearchaeota archaeon]
MDENKTLVIFQDKKIRRIGYNNERYFSVVDVVAVLIDSLDGRKYWNKLSQRLKEEGNEVVTICHRLKLIAEYFNKETIDYGQLIKIKEDGKVVDKIKKIISG